MPLVIFTLQDGWEDAKGGFNHYQQSIYLRLCHFFDSNKSINIILLIFVQMNHVIYWKVFSLRLSKKNLQIKVTIITSYNPY